MYHLLKCSQQLYWEVTASISTFTGEETKAEREGESLG